MSERTGWRFPAAIWLLTALLTGPVATASEATRQALATCHEAAYVRPDSARALVDAGLALAEAAIEAEPDDPAAHFAVFCNIAKRMRLDGLGPWVFRNLRRARGALDRSLALDPDYPDALAGKGALLYYLPRFAGGDVAAGEHLIRRALALDPDNPARLVLVDLLTYRHAVEDARREATKAVAIVRASEDPSVRAGARALLDHLCARQWPPRVGEVLLAECRRDRSRASSIAPSRGQS